MKTKYRLLAMLLAILMLLSACGTSPSTESGNKESDPAVNSEAPSGETSSIEGSGSTVNDISSYVRLTEAGTLTIGTPRSADRMEPGNTSAGTAVALVYETLFTRTPDNELVGLLAKEWEWIDDTTLKITLQDDVYFSNGEKLKPEDVLFSLERLIITESRMSGKVNMINFDECEIIDDTTFTIKYDYVYSMAILVLACGYSNIVCKSYVEGMSDDDWWDHPVGTGPYIMTENVSGSHATFVANENYWGGIEGMGEQPCVDQITLRFYADSGTMFIDYENGVLDIAFELASSDVTRVLNGEIENTNYSIATGWDTMSIVFPSYVEALQDSRVREAIAYAIDKEAVGLVAYGDLGDTNVTSILPPSTPFRAETGNWDYNPDYARELLADAGYSDGDLSFKMVIVNSTANTKAAEAIQGYLKDVGITLTMEAYDRSTAIGMIAGGETDLALHSWGEAFDPDNAFANFLSTGTNATIRQEDPDINEWIKSGVSTIDDAERAEYYNLVQQWLYDDCVVVPMAYVNNCAVYRPYVTDLYAPTLASPDMRYFSVVD